MSLLKIDVPSYSSNFMMDEAGSSEVLLHIEQAAWRRVSPSGEYCYVMLHSFRNKWNAWPYFETVLIST
jgi:hypothetical protein